MTTDMAGAPWLRAVAGSICSALCILAALHERNATGRGRVDMLHSPMGMLEHHSQVCFVSGRAPQPVGTKLPSIVPDGAFPTRHGHPIVACPTDGFWRPFARCLDLPDTRFAEYAREPDDAGGGNRSAAAEGWLDRLDTFDEPSESILDAGEALEPARVGVLAWSRRCTLRRWAT